MEQQTATERAVVKFTKNEYLLDVIHKDLMTVKLLTIEGNINDAYQAALFTYSDIRGGLSRTIKNFSGDEYIKKFKDVLEDIKKEKSSSLDSNARLEAFMIAREKLWRIYDEMMTDLYNSGMIFSFENRGPPGDAIIDDFEK